ncbi:MAG: type IV-A pilus assembly ATPase PilB [Gammaproteobacteria bacterium]|nr:type IV-A pilus assembly ATPase PilB [Gammaproteobacteria bacterium]
MAATAPKIALGGLPRRLIQDGLLTEAKAQDAFATARKDKRQFVSYIVEKKLAAGREVAHSVAHELKIPLADIDAMQLDRDIISLVGEEHIKKQNALPLFRRGNRLFVAVSDPTNFQALDAVKGHANAKIKEKDKDKKGKSLEIAWAEAVVVDEERLGKAIERAVEMADTNMDALGSGDDDFDLEEEVDDKAKEDEEAASEAEEAPVVRFVNKMLLDAIRKGASDLHFEPYEKYYRVRFRIDGVLKEVTRVPLSLKMKIAARIKVMSRLDVSERRVPQDGRIKLKLSKTQSIDFRVSTCPTLFGEKTVMRILNSDAAALDIDMLGYEDFQKQLYLEALARPYGMVLVTGPTGSGKTVSLYTGINILNKVDVNISTAEDPVEINLAGVNQVQVDERTGMSFEKALKAFLRQDPDIILVGEIRDLTTGGIAIKAAQTGHMVMSTLHTNDAPQTLTRMIDMGIQPFAIATAVNLIMAQRLCRRLCKNCKQQVTVIEDPAQASPTKIHRDALLEEGFTEQDLQVLQTGEKKLYARNPNPCDNCTGGYKGRVGVYQVMPISDMMKRLIMEGSNAIALADQARKEGIPDLRESGIKKVIDGVTSLEEVNRVTKE